MLNGLWSPYKKRTWDLERWIQAFESKCYMRMLGISYREHKTNEYVWQQVDILVRRQELLLSTFKRRRLSWFGHVCRHATLPKIILQGTVDGSCCRGRPRKSWKGNIKEWTCQSPSRGWQRSIGSHRSGCIGRGTPSDGSYSRAD